MNNKSPDQKIWIVVSIVATLILGGIGFLFLSEPTLAPSNNLPTPPGFPGVSGAVKLCDNNNFPFEKFNSCTPSETAPFGSSNCRGILISGNNQGKLAIPSQSECMEVNCVCRSDGILPFLFPR